MHEVSIDQLQRGIEGLHHCSSRFRESVKVKEEFEGNTVWEGMVHVFDVDHPEADTCYAWSSPMEGSDNRKFYAVLHIPPVDSPVKAVRAAIAADHKGIT